MQKNPLMILCFAAANLNLQSKFQTSQSFKLRLNTIHVCKKYIKVRSHCQSLKTLSTNTLMETPKHSIRISSDIALSAYEVLLIRLFPLQSMSST